jgi:DNA-binding protein
MANSPADFQPLLSKSERGLRDPAWQFVGAIFACVSIVAAVTIFLYQRDVKHLDVTFRSNASLVKISDTVAGDIEVFYRGQPVKSVTLLEVSIQNTGNQIIRQEDYVRPLQFRFPPEAKIVEVHVTTDPLGIDLVPEINASNVTLSKSLLNPKDWVLVKILVLDLPQQNGVQSCRAIS